MSKTPAMKEWVSKISSDSLKSLEIHTDIDDLKAVVAGGVRNEEKTLMKTFMWHLLRRYSHLKLGRHELDVSNASINFANVLFGAYLATLSIRVCCCPEVCS